MEIRTSKSYNALNEDSDKRPQRGPGDDAAGYGDFFSQDRNRLRTCAPKNLDWRHYYTDHKAILDYLKFSMPSKDACHEPAWQRECRGARREEQAKGSREATQGAKPCESTRIEIGTSKCYDALNEDSDKRLKTDETTKCMRGSFRSMMTKSTSADAATSTRRPQRGRPAPS